MFFTNRWQSNASITLFGVTRLQLRNVTPEGTIGLCLSDKNTPFLTAMTVTQSRAVSGL